MVGKWNLPYKQGKSLKFLQYSPPTRIESIISGNRPEILFLKSHNKERLAMRDFIILEAAFISSRSPARHLWTVQSLSSGIFFAQSKRLAGFPKRLREKKDTQVFPVSLRAVKISNGTREHCRVRTSLGSKAAKIIRRFKSLADVLQKSDLATSRQMLVWTCKTLLCCLLMIKLR